MADKKHVSTITEGNYGDLAFIVHAREDLPWLLAEVRRLRGVVERYGHHLPQCPTSCDCGQSGVPIHLHCCTCGLTHALADG